MRLSSIPVVLALLTLPGLEARAQSDSLTRGFEATARATATAEDMAQSGLWVMEVDFKPIRLVRVELPDPETGELREETIYYIVYRAENKALEGPPKDPTRIPVNNYDAPPGPSLFVPEFTLVSADQEQVVAYSDVVLPKAQQRIVAREMRGSLEGVPLKNSVEVVQPVQPPGSQDAKPIYGVAMFRGVNPEIDRFKVYAGGFSNGFRQIKGPDGKPLILRREIMLDIWRPGDQFALDESEFRFDAQPRWIFRAEDAKPTEAGRDAATGEPIPSEPESKPESESSPEEAAEAAADAKP